MTRSCLAALMLASVCLPSTSQTLLNGGFERKVLPDGVVGNYVTAAWSNALLLNPDDTGAAVNMVASWDTYAGLPQAFSGQQYVSLGSWLQTGIEQAFTVDVAGRYAVTWADNSLFFPDFFRQSPYIVSISRPGQPEFWTSLDASHQGLWREHQTSAILSPGAYTLRFQATRVTSGNVVPTFIDDVRVSAIPEPSAALLFLAGLGLVVRTSRRTYCTPSPSRLPARA